MESLAQLLSRFSAMPYVLRIAAGASLVIGAVFPLLPFIPGASFGVGERELSQPELWQTRVALALFVVGALMLAVGLGVLLRRAWARPLLVVLPVLQGLPFLAVHWFASAPSPFSSLWLFAASCVVWALVAVAYLFGSKSAREHFSHAT